ncbi:hypothetical protein GIB67_033570 [Kingdonia uniflora]|uniref:Uncharacterized protein n=1 Tax=Kingdonia uniflora TaxID=39325 RepID=A0A7J7L681_9MAGN|nr:hypothetical protein GIB67_033570 [Kingdonia uniflora]
MKTLAPTSSSSSLSLPLAKSTTTMEDRSETHESCYFQGCRKDANCKCEICLVSINATLDLIPTSAHSSLTNLSTSMSPSSERKSITYNRSKLWNSTPMARIPQTPTTPHLKSTAKTILSEKKEEKRMRNLGFGFGFYFWRLLMGISVIFAVISVFSSLVSALFQQILSPTIVKKVNERSLFGKDLIERIEFLQGNLSIIGSVKVSNCDSVDSFWELHKFDVGSDYEVCFLHGLDYLEKEDISCALSIYEHCMEDEVLDLNHDD